MRTRRKRRDGTFSQAEDVASATECTGLMPALPQDAAQDENEAGLYGIHSANQNRGED